MAGRSLSDYDGCMAEQSACALQYVGFTLKTCSYGIFEYQKIIFEYPRRILEDTHGIRECPGGVQIVPKIAGE